MALYASDGSINVEVVDGTTLTGLYSPAGAWNVVDATLDGGRGVYAPCGALRVTLVASGLVPVHAADGSYNVCVTPYEATGAMKVTILSGALA